MAFIMVTSSAYSRSAPTGMPTPMRDDANTERLQQFREIDGGGFAFGGGICRHDDFFDAAFFQPLDERS